MKPSELFCFKDTVNFAALLFFLATGNKKFQRAMMQMRSILPQLELSRTALLGCRLADARLLVGNYNEGNLRNLPSLWKTKNGRNQP